jgi:hypothetical protein
MSNKTEDHKSMGSALKTMETTEWLDLLRQLCKTKHPLCNNLYLNCQFSTSKEDSTAAMASVNLHLFRTSFGWA